MARAASFSDVVDKFGISKASLKRLACVSSLSEVSVAMSSHEHVRSSDKALLRLRDRSLLSIE